MVEAILRAMTKAMNELTDGKEDPDGVAVVQHQESKKQVTVEWKGDLIHANDDDGWTYMKMGTSEVLIHGNDLAIYSNQELKNCYLGILDTAPRKISFFRQIVGSIAMGEKR